MRLRWVEFAIRRKILRGYNNANSSELQQMHVHEEMNINCASPCGTFVANLAS